MGYSHYWRVTEEVENKILRHQEEISYYIGQVIDSQKRFLTPGLEGDKEARFFGVETSQPVGGHKGGKKHFAIWLNGKGENQHDDFYFSSDSENRAGQDVKTNRKPYDLAVCLCLSIIRAYTDMHIGSDGFSCEEGVCVAVNGKIAIGADGSWGQVVEKLSNMGFACNLVVKGKRSVTSSYIVIDYYLDIKPPPSSVKKEIRSFREDEAWASLRQAMASKPLDLKGIADVMAWARWRDGLHGEGIENRLIDYLRYHQDHPKQATKKKPTTLDMMRGATKRPRMTVPQVLKAIGITWSDEEAKSILESVFGKDEEASTKAKKAPDFAKMGEEAKQAASGINKKSPVPVDFEEFRQHALRLQENKSSKISKDLDAALYRPQELSVEGFARLKDSFASAGFTAENLRRSSPYRAFEEGDDVDASLWGFIRHAILNVPLLPYESRVDEAYNHILAKKEWNPDQQRYLRYIRDQFIANTVIDLDSFDRGLWEREGKFERLNKIFDGELADLFHEFKAAIWPKKEDLKQREEDPKPPKEKEASPTRSDISFGVLRIAFQKMIKKIVMQKGRGFAPTESEAERRIEDLARKLIEVVKDEIWIVDFFARPHAQSVLQKKLVIALDDSMYFDMKEAISLGDEMFQHIISRRGDFRYYTQDPMEKEWDKKLSQIKTFEHWESAVAELIRSENLKPDLARRYIADSIRRGSASEHGMDLVNILPPMPRFTGEYREMKHRVHKKISDLIEVVKGKGNVDESYKALLDKSLRTGKLEQ